MKLLEGKLKRLGEYTLDMKSEIVNYSLIQIGDQTLTNALRLTASYDSSPGEPRRYSLKTSDISS